MHLILGILLTLWSCGHLLAEEKQSSVDKAPATFERTILFKTRAKGTGRVLTKVELTAKGQQLYSDGKGEVTLTVGADGVVTFRKFGFEALTINYSEIPATTNEMTVYLFPGEPDDNEVVIQGKRRQEVSSKVVTIRETARVAPGGDPAQITKLLPGVDSSAFGNEVIIRGSGPADSRYFVDDIEVPLIFHQIGSLSVIPESLLSEVEFSSGGFGPQYGNATGGIITLRTTSEVKENPRTELKLNVPFFLTVTHERPLSESSSLYVSMRHSTTELICLRLFLRIVS